MTSKELAWRIRRDAIEMVHISNSSHIGSVLSIVDIVAVLYNNIMKFYPNNPRNDNRDRFILSKGHAGIAIYSALAELGFFSVKELKTYYSNGSRLSGHVSHKNVPGIELSTGSLGHGVCVATGIAKAGLINKKSYRVFTIIGDGECDEGSVWEMALFANHFKLSNLSVIIDHNKMQSLGKCEDTLKLLNLPRKWETFGWKVLEIDGHSHEQIRSALLYKSDNKPVCIVANTIKGKGISFMENNIEWHYKAPQGKDYVNAIKELEESKP